MECNPNILITDIFNELKAAYKQRKKINHMADELSLDYRTTLALVKVEVGEIKAAVLYAIRTELKNREGCHII